MNRSSNSIVGGKSQNSSQQDDTLQHLHCMQTVCLSHGRTLFKWITQSTTPLHLISIYYRHLHYNHTSSLFKATKPASSSSPQSHSISMYLQCKLVPFNPKWSAPSLNSEFRPSISYSNLSTDHEKSHFRRTWDQSKYQYYSKYKSCLGADTSSSSCACSTSCNVYMHRDVHHALS